MTTPTPTRRKSTALARAAGVLLVLAGIGMLASLAFYAWSQDPNVPDNDYSFGRGIEALIFGFAARVLLFAAFLILWIWRLRSPWHLAYLAIALGNVGILLLTAIFWDESWTGALRTGGLVLIAAGAVLAASVTVWRDPLALSTRITFAVALLAIATAAVILIPSDEIYAVGFGEPSAYIAAALLIVAGLVLVIRPKARSTTAP
jgi:hypothetical protein